jgi:hypothetical protein
MKKLFFILFLTIGFLNLLQAQNAIVGTGFSTGWGSTCSPTSSLDYFNFVASVGTTYTSGDLTPKGTGDQYWRLAINWSSTYYQISGGSDIFVTPGTKNTTSSVTCTTTGAWKRNVSAITNRYVFKTLNVGVSPTGTWVFFELGGASATVNWVSQSPATPTVNEATTITATLSGALPTGQGVYLRYSTDNWATSTVSGMSGSGTTYATTIGAQALNTAVKYYVFTSGSGLTIAPADADLYTINWNAGGINGGGNYLYTVAAAPATTYIGKYLFDFGPTAGTHGDNTTGADANGNYWNNISSGVGGAGITTPTTFTALVNSSNTASAYALTTTVGGFVSNGKNNGGLRTPYNSQFMAAGSDPDLAIGTATEDFWYTPNPTTPAFKISGLNPNKKYRFKIFGTRNGSVLRTAQYTIVGAATTVGTLNNSTVAGMGGSVYTPTGYSVDVDNSFKLNSQTGYTTATTYYGNTSSTYDTGIISPNSSGEFTLTLASTQTGQNAFINCMKMEEYKGAQTITFGALSSKTVGDATFGLTATASSGVSVTYTSSNTGVATVSGSTVTVLAAGSTTITASQAGDGTYDAATNVTQSLTVSAGSLTAQTITFGSLSAKTIGDASFGLTATANSGLAVSYSSSNTAVATVSGSTVTIVGAGTSDITASQAGNGLYAAAPNVIQTLTVNKLNQTITFGALSTKTDADVPYSVSPSSTSGLTVTLTSSNSNVALVSGTTITIVGSGTSTITASQAGNATYNAATSVPQTLTVSSTLSVNQNLFFDFGPNETTNGDVTVNPDVNGNYWNNITPSAGGVGVTNGTSYSSLLNSSNSATSYGLAFTAAGFITNGKLNGGLLSPYASQFGSNSELAIATATEDYIYTGATTHGPVITFSGLNQSKRYRFKIFGCRNSNTDRSGQYTLQGAGAATVGTLQSSTATGLGGTVYIDAATSYPANLNVSYTLTSSGSNTQAVTYYGNNSSVYYSGLIQPDGSGNVTLTTISTTPTQAFAYINALKIEEFATAQTITFGALSAKNYGDADYSAGATSSSGLTVSLSSSNTAVATIVSGQIHIVAPGTTTITASQVGNSTYSPATSVSQSLTVNKASSSITATGTTSYNYNHSPQGPASATESGSTGAISYSYSGTGGTTYAASATKPTNVGTYQVIATVAADANYNTASSTALAFSITAVTTTVPVSIISNPLGTYPLDQSVTWTFDLTGSAFNAGEDLYLWIWSPSEPDFGNWTNSSSFAKLSYVSGMVWSMTLTPTSYFSKTVSEIQASAGFWMLLKDKSGNIQTANFSVSQTINRQVISITDNQTSTALTNIFADVNVSGTGLLTIDANRTINSITIAPSGKLTLNTGNTLTATSGVVLQSNSSGTATFVDNNTSSPQAVTGTVEQYLSSARNWYLSSPISGATVPTGQTYYSYDETGSNTSFIAPATANWVAIPEGASINPTKGYIAQPGAAITKSYTGTFNTGTKTVELTRTNSATKPGFNLIANPYPSYLDWSLVDSTAAHIMSTVWYRTKTSGGAYTFDTYNGGLNVATSNGENTVTRLIPPMQAFWVRVKSGFATGTLTFMNAMRKHIDYSGNKFKAPSFNTTQILRLLVSTGTNSDEALICFNSNASNGFDDYDSPKMTNANAAIPEIYSLAGTEQVVINGLNGIESNQEVPLGFTTGQSNTFSIKASEVNNFDGNTRIILKDKLLNTEQDLTAGGVYSFTSDITSSTSRFSLMFKSPSVTTAIDSNENNNSTISIYKNLNNQISIAYSGIDKNGIITICNSIGQKLVITPMTGANTTIYNLFKEGVYVVCVNINGNNIVKKITIN